MTMGLIIAGSSMGRCAFGKLERDVGGQVIGFHSLTGHMTDVAACFYRLCQCRSIRRLLESSAGRSLSDIDIARLTVLAFLHDVGKANSGFQAKFWQSESDIPSSWPVRIHAGHGVEVFKLFEEPSAVESLSPVIERVFTWGGACESLLIASISHHGRPLKGGRGTSPRLWKSLPGDYDPAETLREVAACALRIYPEAFSPGGDPLPDKPEFGHFFAGLIQLADWLGSDTRFFSFGVSGESERNAHQRAAAAVASIGLDVEDWRRRLEIYAPKFATAFDVAAPRPIQAAMADDTLGPLVILESETGSGKTEAALWRFVRLFQDGLVDSLYFALPTRVAATQLYRRVTDTLRRLWPENPPLCVRALPGYVSADEVEVASLAGFEVLWADGADELKAHRRWAAESAKRFLAAPVAVGTIDQALLGALQVRHAHLRLSTLARSLLVIDEVHASDAYMTAVLERLLKTHLAAGGHALLLSATLGSSARERYLALTPKDRSHRIKQTSFDVACRVPYPAISDCLRTRGIEGCSKAKTVAWTTRDLMDSPEQIAQLAINAAAEGAKVLIIRNTVPGAVAAQAALERNVPVDFWLFRVNGVATLHHSRFSRQDRPLMDATIEAQLGKRRPAGAMIVVGTQTLEQSLDIDADLLITDLCPMDVLLQRIGRLHRHSRAEKERPVAYRRAQVIVLTPVGGDLSPMLTRPKHGLGRFQNGGGVYADLRTVEATRLIIVGRPEVSIPADNRYLVEAATHPERLTELQKQLGAAWELIGQKIEGDTGAQVTIGHLHRLDVEQVFGETEFPVDVQVATRLGAQDRILHFNNEPGPFGLSVKELPLRHHLLPKGLSPDVEPSAIDNDGKCITFRLGEARFCYSRLGLERLSDD